MGCNKLVLVVVASASAAVLIAYLCGRDTFDAESIRGKRVLVTGASTGIGEQLAYHYCRLGASVVIAARRADVLSKVAAKCRDLGAAKVEHVAADMYKPDDRVRLVSETKRLLGGRLDHLVLNHALYRMSVFKGTDEDMDNFNYDLQVNFVSYVDIAAKLLDVLTASQGSIGVVSSGAGKMTMPYFASYISDKFALQGFFAALRQELTARKTGVSVTLCVIGYVGTENAMKAMDAMQGQLPKGILLMNLQPPPARADDTALAIIKGVSRRDYEIYYPFAIRLFVILHKFFPEWLEDNMY